MTNNALFRVNVRNGEIEIQGSEEFIERQIQQLESTLETILQLFEVVEKEEELVEGVPEEEPREPITADKGVPDSFLEWLYKFPKNVNDQEKALIAGYFLQHNSADNRFLSSDVPKLLRDNGVTIQNSNVQLRRLAAKRLIIPVGRSGRRTFYRVSQQGQEYLYDLMRKAH